MAEFWSNNDRGYRIRLWIDQTSQNIEGNYSKIRVRLALLNTTVTFADYNCTAFVDLNGQRLNWSGRPDMTSRNSTIMLIDETITVGHNDDGKKILGLMAEFSGSGGWSPRKLEIGGNSFTLSTIPRASAGSSANGIFGQPITLNISRHSDAFKHSIWVKFGDYDKKIAGDNVDTSVTWTPEMSMINEIPNASSGYGTLTYITYNNGREIGRNTQPVALSVPDNIKPTLTGFTLTDTNTAAANVVPGEQAFIQILSNIKVNFGQAAGAYGSAVTGYYAEVVGKNQSTTTQGGTLGIMNYTGDVTIRARVTDTRGRTSNTIERVVNILEYFAPVLSFNVVRSGAQSSTLTITRNAKIAPLTVNNVQKNQMKLTFKVAKFSSNDYKVDTGSASGTWTTVASLTNSNANLQGDYAANSSWMVLGILEDKFTRTEFAVNVATESVVMSYSKDRIGFGKIAEFPNVTDSAWEYYFKGEPIQNRRLTNADGRNLANVYKTPDDYVTTGFYYSDSSLLPDRSGGYLLVESYNADFVKQTYTPWDKAYTFIRLKIGKNKPWTAWVSPALEQCYPIGSIYQSTEPTNPTTFMGGVWERFGNGRVLVGVDEADADFNAPNKIGGNKQHRHLAGNLEAAIGTIDGNTEAVGYKASNINNPINDYTYGISGSNATKSSGKIQNHNTAILGSTGFESSLPPYITIYRWRRTA